MLPSSSTSTWYTPFSSSNGFVIGCSFGCDGPISAIFHRKSNRGAVLRVNDLDASTPPVPPAEPNAVYTIDSGPRPREFLAGAVLQAIHRVALLQGFIEEHIGGKTFLRGRGALLVELRLRKPLFSRAGGPMGGEASKTRGQPAS
jgi:hypothetical protein